MNEIRKIAPVAIWDNFQKLCDTPRPSNKEEAVLQLLEKMADDKGLAHFRDSGSNLVVSVPATAGFEDRKIVILQAHVDMVTQANSGSTHNFDTDPIRMVMDGEWITADNTTLGADNGIGAAAMMGFMTEDDLEHGPLELLFTVDEERGLTGAMNLEPGRLKGEILLNLDTEDEYELCVGCAGGGDLVASYEYAEEAVGAGQVAREIALTGLKGGHSGIDIILGLGNANKLMARFLRTAIRDFGARIVAINAGTARNAIPRESFATIVLPEGKVSDFEAALSAFADDVKDEIGAIEPNFAIRVTEADLPAKAMSAKDSKAFNNACVGAPNGVQAMSTSVEGVVETSINLAIVKLADGKADVTLSARSSINSARDAMREVATAVFENIGASVAWGDAYPGWKPDANSEVVSLMKSVHKDMFGKEPEIRVIHAGLECGVLGSKYPHWDMVSFGPTIKRAHSPDECVHVPSVARFWDYLLAALKAIPAKG
ncbi:aminoacyl-histidine dipeptidase [Thalassospira sp. HJ]|uniref:aminoacyl-histidine dipeptidase n=1 Tax=Thalassospira sp. HJ TaxID=1616823 RepID=UPI0005CEC763|nr:aminoacyl-histidine dipeptidase [Thalassospira sp. HJ]KJE35331.1 aminoacyl-histidine dipeptidase [Thalassospira sp. HJ]